MAAEKVMPSETIQNLIDQKVKLETITRKMQEKIHVIENKLHDSIAHYCWYCCKYFVCTYNCACKIQNHTHQLDHQVGCKCICFIKDQWGVYCSTECQKRLVAVMKMDMEFNKMIDPKFCRNK